MEIYKTVHYSVTGNITGDIIDGPKKAEILKTIATVENINLQQTIALGDGPNDLEMIEAGDYGVIIPNPAGTSVQSEVDSVIRAPSPGPAGWVASLSDILGALGCT